MWHMLRVLAPSLATLVLIGLLVFTIFLTAFDWQWIAFLSGILCAAVFSLVSASWKSAWRIARRTAQAARFKALYAAEREQHRHARESLEREMALRKQDSERLARNADDLKAAADKARTASNLLDMLEHELKEIAFLVDRDLRYRFHTRGFAAWAQAQPLRIDGHPLDEPLRAQVAGALKAPLAEALHGRRGCIELDDGPSDTEGKRFAVTFIPHYGLPNEVTGVLIRITEVAQAALPAREQSVGARDGAAPPRVLPDATHRAPQMRPHRRSSKSKRGHRLGALFYA